MSSSSTHNQGDLFTFPPTRKGYKKLAKFLDNYLSVPSASRKTRNSHKSASCQSSAQSEPCTHPACRWLRSIPFSTDWKNANGTRTMVIAIQVYGSAAELINAASFSGATKSTGTTLALLYLSLSHDEAPPPEQPEIALQPRRCEAVPDLSREFEIGTTIATLSGGRLRSATASQDEAKDVPVELSESEIVLLSPPHVPKTSRRLMSESLESLAADTDLEPIIQAFSRVFPGFPQDQSASLGEGEPLRTREILHSGLVEHLFKPFRLV